MSAAATYADALHAAASEAGAVADVGADLEAFRAAGEESPELAAALASPEVETRARKAIVAALTEQAHPLVSNFLQVLIDRGRIEELPEIAAAYAERVDEAEGRVEVRAITAVALSDELRAHVARRLEEKLGRSVELSESVDPELIGGLVLELEGAVVDGSVRGRLAGLHAALRAAPVDAAAAAE